MCVRSLEENLLGLTTFKHAGNVECGKRPWGSAPKSFTLSVLSPAVSHSFLPVGSVGFEVLANMFGSLLVWQYLRAYRPTYLKRRHAIAGATSRNVFKSWHGRDRGSSRFHLTAFPDENFTAGARPCSSGCLFELSIDNEGWGKNISALEHVF